MDVGSSQPLGQAGRTRLLSLRRRNRDPVPSSTKQLPETMELLLPPHHQLENASPTRAPSRASGESEVKFETGNDKVEEEEREAQGPGLAGGQMEQSGHVCVVPLSGVGGSKKSRAKKGEVDRKKERVQGRLDLGLKAEDGDFTDMPPPEVKPKQRRKRKRNEQPKSYLEAVEDDELQLALALSASLDPLQGIEQSLSTAEEAGRQKKRKRGRKGEVGVAPPLLTVSSSQASNILAERAEQILEAQGCDGSDDEIPCTPAFGTSELAQPHEAEPQRCSPTTVLHDHHDESVALPFLTSDHEEKSQNIASDVNTLKRDHQEAEEVVVIEETVDSPLESVGGSSKLESGVNLCDSEQGEQREGLEMDVACDTDQQMQGEGLPLKKDVEVLTPGPEVSFHANSQELSYQTLWKLTSYREEEDISNFYVPGLATVISPRKGPACVPSSITGASSFSHGVDKLIVDLYSLIGSPLLSDAVITTRNGARIPAHAVILACRSPALSQVIAQCSERPVLLDFSDFDEETVFAFLECVYSGSTSLLKEESMRRNLAHIAQRWSMEEIVLLCDNWKDDDTTAGDHDAHWEGKSAISIPTSPIMDTKLLPSSHLSKSTVENSDDRTALETHTQSATEHLSTHLLASAVECTVLVDPSVPATTPALESFLCDEVVKTPAVNTPVGTAATRADAELQLKNIDNVRRGDTLLVASDKECEATVIATCTVEGTPTMVSCTVEGTPNMVSCGTVEGTPTMVSCTVEGTPNMVSCGTVEGTPTMVSCTVEGTPTMVSCTVEGTPTMVSCTVEGTPNMVSCGTVEGTPTMVSCTVEGTPTMVSCTVEGTPTMVTCSMPADCTFSETMNNSTSDEHSSTRAVRLPSDVICVSSTPSPVICMSTSPESDEKSPRDRRDDACLSGDSSDDILFCIPPTPSDNLLQATELSPRHVVNLSGDLPLPYVTINTPSSPTASENSECTTDWLVTRSPQASRPMLLGASPVVRQLCRGNQAVQHDRTGGKVFPGVDHSPPSCVRFKTPQVVRSCTAMQGLVREQCTTPACGGIVLESDDNITPMPAYRTMTTPILKEECSQFGVKPLPKKQMVAKLQEIYEYTHPLVDKDGNILAEDSSRKNINASTTTSTRPATAKPASPKKRTVENQVNVKTKRKDYQDRGGDESSQGSVAEGEDVGQRIKEFIMSAKDLYQDILLYKPLELSLIQARLKSAGIAVGKGRLADILDHWCVTYSAPRMTQKHGRRTGIKSVV